MCGQWSQASQAHSGSRSPMPGSRSTPAAAASSTRCGGISRSSSAAMCPARSTAMSRKRSHSPSVSSWSSTSLRYPLSSRSRTTAVIRPGRTDTAPTRPSRANRRPFLSCWPSSAVSSRAFSQARPHQDSAKPRPCAGGSAAKVRSCPGTGSSCPSPPNVSGSYPSLIVRPLAAPPDRPVPRR